MTDFYDGIKALLDAGTWTNYGSEPDVYEYNASSKKHKVRLYIEIEITEAESIRTTTGSRVLENQIGNLRIRAENKTDRDNIEADVEAILLASSEMIQSNISKRSANPRNYQSLIRIKRTV